MGSITNSLTSSNTATNGNTNTTGIFTGSSAYSNDFQNLINRAVAIASLPINLLTSQQTALTNQFHELDTLQTKFAALQSAVQGISAAMGGASFQSTSSAPAAVTATLSDGATEGIYNIKVDNPGIVATSLSTATWNPPALDVNQVASYGLVIGNQVYPVTTSDNSVQGVAAAITAQYGSQVHAVAVNVGNYDWRISLQSTALGPVNLNLFQVPSGASAASLQTQQSPATSLTTATWNAAADAAGTESQYTLAVGSSHYNFAAGDNSAQTVAAAINAEFGRMVNATVVDLGTGASHDYRIALQDKTGTSPTLDIQRTIANSFQTQQTAGALAEYELDGAAPATSDSASINVANGVTLNLLGANTGNPVSVTVTQSTSALSTALAAFADAYNACVDECAGQRGQSAGPLQGQSMLSTLSHSMSSLALFGSSTGSINALHDLGLDLGTDGHLTYTALNFMVAGFSNAAGVDTFLGSPTGGGFLKAATDVLANLEDPTTGLIKTSETNLQTQITNIGDQISTKQTQLDTMQTQLTSQMAAADALIASMEQQYSYLSSMFQAQQTADQMYK